MNLNILMKITMTKNSINLQDAHERQRALDPTQSFIVQAPAGSGKTELLSQRFLVLLSCVKQPEEILAITFTKKSAAEMRARIIKALKNAFHQPEPKSEHEKQTWLLAKQALERNFSLGWNLLDNPNRLQIQTIDSFNASLTRQLPLLSKFGAPLEITEEAALLYKEAVQEFLSHLEENVSWADAIEKLLIHMDNDLAGVEKLLINMLAKRDQWLIYIISTFDHPELRNVLENSLEHIITDTLEMLCDFYPIEYGNELIELAQFAAENIAKETNNSPLRQLINLTDFPGSSVNDKKIWHAFSKLLLTEEGSWRKSIDKRSGFPKEADGKTSDEKKRFANNKMRIQELIKILSENVELHQALKELSRLPDAQYQDSDWETLEALRSILRIVVAQLNIVFQQHGKIDYIENALAALAALGTEDNPTDLTLALDYKIQHILIDEFQDTSNNQYRLLEKLITGWQANDGRSLFVVGDPMQSIYRFREAEVGLFIRARQQGIGHLYLEPLTLKVNFRSTPGIVNWINDSFEQVLPPFEDIASGAVSYSRSSASQMDAQTPSSVTLHPFINANESAQANAIIQIIHDTKLSYPNNKIVILVRSRTHLKSIIPALKSASLPFRALDIEPLTTRPVIQDLLALTRALIHPADRIAWLAILRAPWCGMTLADLLHLANDKNKSIIWEQLISPEITHYLSIDGKQRLERILPILRTTLAERRRYTVRQWVEYSWLQLGGPACIAQPSDIEDANAFFNLLDKLDQAGHLQDIDRLIEAVNKLYAAPNNHANDLLQIMTIHNSKGLEFDTVIIPHLERKSSSDDKQLLQWMERTRVDDINDLILAPIRAIGDEKNIIYDYIKHQHTIKTEYENGRLLYVAATRAKKQLHILFNLTSKENKEVKLPVNNSLLHKLWPAIHTQVTPSSNQTVSLNHLTIEKEESMSQIKRLTSDWVAPYLENNYYNIVTYDQNKAGFGLPQNNAKHIGILIHQVLQHISQFGTTWWKNPSSLARNNYLTKHLQQLGMLNSSIPDAISSIEEAISSTLSDARGQWILHAHTEAKSEFALTVQSKHFVIDRTFIDEQGVRWIIDYKSSHPVGISLEEFLNTEKKLYEKQLWEYHQAISMLDKRPICVGLYFPLISAWKEWSFTDHDL